MMDTVVDPFSEWLPQIYVLLAKTLQYPESLEVRITTLQALGRVAEYIEANEEASIVGFISSVYVFPMPFLTHFHFTHLPRARPPSNR